MKFVVIAALLGLNSMASATWGTTIATCGRQAPCLDITVEPSEHTSLCTNDSCEYKVCIKFDFYGHCQKSVFDRIYYTCPRDDSHLDMCFDEEPTFSHLQLISSGHGYTQCQIVPGGDVAYFLIKDGNGCYGADATADTNVPGLTAQCNPRTADIPSCTGNGVGHECIW